MVILLCMFFSCHYYGLSAAGSLQKRYTAERPLIYEDAWEKWPYAFIDGQRKPDGFDVELVREVMRRLNLPYEVRLRHQDSVHVDLKERRADLSFGVAANYNAHGSSGTFVAPVRPMSPCLSSICPASNTCP